MYLLRHRQTWPLLDVDTHINPAVICPCEQEIVLPGVAYAGPPGDQ